MSQARGFFFFIIAISITIFVHLFIPYQQIFIETLDVPGAGAAVRLRFRGEEVLLSPASQV